MAITLTATDTSDARKISGPRARDTRSADKRAWLAEAHDYLMSDIDDSDI